MTTLLRTVVAGAMEWSIRTARTAQAGRSSIRPDIWQSQHLSTAIRHAARPAGPCECRSASANAQECLACLRTSHLMPARLRPHSKRGPKRARPDVQCYLVCLSGRSPPRGRSALIRCHFLSPRKAGSSSRRAPRRGPYIRWGLLLPARQRWRGCVRRRLQGRQSSRENCVSLNAARPRRPTHRTDFPHVRNIPAKDGLRVSAKALWLVFAIVGSHRSRRGQPSGSLSASRPQSGRISAAPGPDRVATGSAQRRKSFIDNWSEPLRDATVA